jgi:hypothetical protein
MDNIRKIRSLSELGQKKGALIFTSREYPPKPKTKIIILDWSTVDGFPSLNPSGGDYVIGGGKEFSIVDEWTVDDISKEIERGMTIWLIEENQEILTKRAGRIALLENSENEEVRRVFAILPEGWE